MEELGQENIPPDKACVLYLFVLSVPKKKGRYAVNGGY